jgi:hypothetical protein
MSDPATVKVMIIVVIIMTMVARIITVTFA